MHTHTLYTHTAWHTDWGAGNGVVIEVCDNGPGIDPADLPLIFNRGYRGALPRASGTPGTGLGLGIAQDLMRCMSGDIVVGNRCGHAVVKFANC
jgi:two-component system, OmpR family, sensor kinase